MSRYLLNMPGQVLDVLMPVGHLLVGMQNEPELLQNVPVFEQIVPLHVPSVLGKIQIMPRCMRQVRKQVQNVQQLAQ